MDALQFAFEPAARLWLQAGAKYATSKRIAGGAWNISLESALKPYGLSLRGCANVFEAADVFRPRWKWKPDPMFQLWDVVYPPANLLARGGDDCDGWAMAHAQAVEAGLSDQGWHSAIISYYAGPWWMSHHFAVAIDPHGGYWVLQPQPAEEQPEDSPTVYGPYGSFDDCLKQVSSWYQVGVGFWDIRTSMWESFSKEG